jgi:hypothetical protein
MWRADSRVYRHTPLPSGPLKGRFRVIEDVVKATEDALRTFGGPDGPHEGMVFWGGLEFGDITLFTTVVVPRCQHHATGVFCDEVAVRDAVRFLRMHRVGLLAQVHSHPGDDVRHSDGDDLLIFLPFDGMLSIVVQRYGLHGMLPINSSGIHQFQHKKWTLCTQNLDAITVIPRGVDLR